MGCYPCTQDVYKVNPKKKKKKKKSNEPTDLAACSHVYEDYRKKKLRLSYGYSCPSKVHAFISLQRHYIKHNRMNFQVSKAFFFFFCWSRTDLSSKQKLQEQFLALPNTPQTSTR